ncbi:MAG: COG1470 family protein, partial [Candidatus Hodarchaeales archaeon]
LGSYAREFTFSITNTGNIADNYTILSSGWDQYLDYSPRVYNLPVGEQTNITVILSIDNPSEVPEGEKSFQIIAVSEASGDEMVSSFSTATVNVLPPDETAPGLEQVYAGQNLTYPFSTPLDLGPTWVPRDDNPDKFTIFVNDIDVFNGSWSDGESYHVNMSGYAVGVYNVTAVFNDTSGNVKTDMVWVTITLTDSSAPVITPPLNQTLPANFIDPLELTWNIHEENLLNATLYRNGTALDNDFVIWQCGEVSCEDDWNGTYTINPGSLSAGTWNLTLTVQDMADFWTKVTVMLTITTEDVLVPSLTVEPSAAANQDHGEIITFTATDVFPSYYQLWIGSELWIDSDYVANHSWQNNTAENLEIDSLPLELGDNSLQLRLYDLAGKVFLYNWTLVLNDIDDPLIVEEPENMLLFEHNISEVTSPFWMVEDLNPGNFTIFWNGSVIDYGIWTAGNNSVTLNIENLGKGIHEFHIVFNDTTGNEVSSTFVITVLDITAPSFVRLKPVEYEPYQAANWFEFIVDDRHPAFYNLYRNGTLLVEHEEMTEFYQVVLVELSDLQMGNYNYTITVIDESGNHGSTSVLVRVNDYTAPIIEGPPFLILSEQQPGKIITWWISEDNPESFSLYRNGTLIDSGSIVSFNGSANYSRIITDLVTGMHVYVFTVEDQKGFSHSLTTYVKVVDNTAPELSRIGDYFTLVGNPSATITWEVSDNNPDSYKITVNGVVMKEESWNGENIALSLTGWSAGNYTVVIQVMDKAGNMAIDEVSVMIVDSDTSSPSPCFGIDVVLMVALLSGLLMKRYRVYNQRKRD